MTTLKIQASLQPDNSLESSTNFRDSHQIFLVHTDIENQVVTVDCHLILVLGIVAAAAGLFVPNAVQKITKESVITSSQLEKAVDISELSTAEFIYNGIADKYSDGNLEETECHIAYASTVKVGIALDQITFTIDEEKKTVTPVLPEITVNTVTVDPDSLSFIPQNPDVELKDIMTVCKEDALKEASESKELYQTAEENLQSAIEALLSPILKNAGYTMQWDI